jgi:hypothetical protein
MEKGKVIDCEKNIFQAAEILGTSLRSGDVVLLKGRYEQRLRRIVFILEGRAVNCCLNRCSITGLHCETCPALKTGWPSHITSI